MGGTGLVAVVGVILALAMACLITGKILDYRKIRRYGLYFVLPVAGLLLVALSAGTGLIFVIVSGTIP